MSAQIQLLGISGSLRKGSYNTSLLHAAQKQLPEGVSMEIASIDDVPMYNADFDLPAAAKRPDAVARLREQMTKADGLVIVSPEYNYGIPGVLKNAIDWASRGEDSPMIGKPVALMGATIGQFGTVRMQLDFLNIFLYLDMKPVNKPEVLIAQAKHKFDEQGNLTDATAMELVKKKLEAMKQMIVGMKK